MLNGPVVVLHMMDESTGKSACGLYLDVNKISAFWARRVETKSATPRQNFGVTAKTFSFEGYFVLCDTNTFCVTESGSEIHDLMIESKQTWEFLQKNSLQ